MSGPNGFKPHPEPGVTPALLERFHASYSRCGDNDCWEWQATRDPFGYGSFPANGRNYRASRISYLVATGIYPGEMMVCHRCDNPPCINPAHLFLGTAADNTADRRRKGRAFNRQGILNPRAKLVPDQVREIRASTESYSKLAERYGVSDTTIYAVRARSRWGHIG